MESEPFESVMVPVRPGAKSTVPPAGVRLIACLSEPGPESFRFVTVVGVVRASRGSRRNRARGGRDGVRRNVPNIGYLGAR
jgi:hypothetical protein